MKPLGRVLLVLGLVGALVAGLVYADDVLRRRTEARISEQLAGQFGAQVSTELGGWPFAAVWLSNRLPDARITLDRAEVMVEERSAIIERIELTAVGLSPVDDLEQARAERLDARVQMTWQDLTLLLGFPVSHVQGDRVSARTSIEFLGVVAVAELQAELGVQPDGRLTLTGASASAAGIEVPSELVQLAVDRLAPTMQLPQFHSVDYERLELDQAGITAVLHGTDVPISQLG